MTSQEALVSPDSLSALKSKMSLPSPPVRLSLPPPPDSVSLPAPPLSALAAPLPVRVLDRLLPTPLIAAEPVRMSLSWKSPRVRVTLDMTVSKPPLLEVSLTTSPALSTW
ncbi:hypothetical protein D3C85_1513500 [compost metagenome]